MATTIRAADEAGLLAERDRFAFLFDGLFRMTSDWIDMAPEERLDSAAGDDPIHRFGDGKTPMTLRNLYIHVAVAEHVWIGAVAHLPAGETAPFPSDPGVATRLQDGDLKKEAEAIHAQNLARVHTLGSAELEKPLFFAKRRWTGIEFLWGVYAHRAFHLGHIDLNLRFAGERTPEFFVFHPTAVG